MKSMKKFAAQQLSKKQMNGVKGGGSGISMCILYRNDEQMEIYILWDEHKEAERQANAAGWDLIC